MTADRTRPSSGADELELRKGPPPRFGWDVRIAALLFAVWLLILIVIVVLRLTREPPKRPKAPAERQTVTLTEYATEHQSAFDLQYRPDRPELAPRRRQPGINDPRPDR